MWSHGNPQMNNSNLAILNIVFFWQKKNAILTGNMVVGFDLFDFALPLFREGYVCLHNLWVPTVLKLV